jgi:hypothetical protein
MSHTPPVEAPMWIGLAVFFTGVFNLGTSLWLGIWLMLCGGYLMFWAFK